ncbi:hypothetical protein H5410_061315, partial [Solanum commersonii]
MPYTNPWTCLELNVLSHRLKVVDEKLNWGKKALHQLSKEKEKLHKMHLIGKKEEVDATHYPIVKKSVKKSHDLHLARCYEIFHSNSRLQLLRRTKKFIYGKFCSYGINSVSQLRANNHEKQSS